MRTWKNYLCMLAALVVTLGFTSCLSAINAENQQIAKQTPSFTPKNVKLGVFVLFKIYPSIVSLWTKK